MLPLDEPRLLVERPPNPLRSMRLALEARFAAAVLRWAVALRFAAALRLAADDVDERSKAQR